MVFSSMTFLCIFLPLFLIVYYALPHARNLVLVIFSLIFYAWGEPIWILALVFSGALDYVNGRIINKYPGGKIAKAVLVESLALNLGLLSLFKYSGFIAGNLNNLFGTEFSVPSFISLPLGISFYTFQTLSYTIDLYRGKISCQKSFISFLAYVTMFPQLVAGPIVRYADVEKDLDERRPSVEQFGRGVSRFAIGLGKKVLLANSAGRAVEILLADASKVSVLGGWLGVLFYGFQIYFDFSGYSDMAIGLGRMLGFEFKENFNYPYVSKSITDFWRRWHISLSSFFRDYIYIPLGGNRRLQIRNLAVVWLLTGLWHGASWNFILWGAYYGALLICEKLFLGKLLARLPAVLGHIYSLAAILVGWSIFYFTSVRQLFAFAKRAVGIGAPLVDFSAESVFFSNIFLLAVLIIASTNLPSILAGRLRERFKGFAFAEVTWNFAIMAVCFAMLIGQSYNPFLYFRF